MASKKTKVKEQVTKNLLTAVEAAAKDLMVRGDLSPPEAAIHVGHVLVGQATSLFGGMMGLPESDLQDLHSQVISVYEIARLERVPRPSNVPEILVPQEKKLILPND